MQYRIKDKAGCRMVFVGQPWMCVFDGYSAFKTWMDMGRIRSGCSLLVDSASLYRCGVQAQIKHNDLDSSPDFFANVTGTDDAMLYCTLVAIKLWFIPRLWRAEWKRSWSWSPSLLFQIHHSSAMETYSMHKHNNIANVAPLLCLPDSLGRNPSGCHSLTCSMGPLIVLESEMTDAVEKQE